MKRLVLLLLFMLLSMSAFATGQACDIIYIDGQRWLLMGRPVDADSVLYHSLQARLPKETVESTDNWDGFIGHWSLVGQHLILDSVTVDVDRDGKEVEIALHDKIMRRVFKKYYAGGHIEASWFTGKLRLGQGREIYYEHMAWVRNYERERLLTVENGIVINDQIFDNHIVVEGFDIDTLKWSDERERFLEGFRPKMAEYPALDTINTLYFIVYDMAIDSTGRLIDAKIRWLAASGIEPITELQLAFKTYLMDIYPWRLWTINGELRPRVTTWSVPLLKRKR